jgi:nitroreductase
MTLMEALKERRAVRDFRPEPLSREILAELVVCATQAPSYMNMQPWAFAVVDDPATVARFGHEARLHLIKRLNRVSPFFAEREAIKSSDYTLFYNAPALIVIYATADHALASIGCTMAAQNVMLAACAMGLGSCFVSQAQPWLDSPEGKEALSVPSSHRAVAPVVVGGTTADPLSPGRFAPQIHWVAGQD